MKSYLKFLSRNKLYTAIEAVGLALSLAFVILIGSYVVQNVLSVFLIALALVMEVQMRHMLTRSMHAVTDNLYYIEY